MIKIDKLTKLYRLGKQESIKALDNVSFSLPNKGMIFIVGKSGSGKSTFLNLLGGLDDITSGEIIFGDKHLSEMNEVMLNRYRNDCVGFVFQDYCLIDKMSVYENIELSLSLQNKKDDELINSIIDKVDLRGFENRMSAKLSGGQKQRVAIARALVKKPKLILADEPTGNLDSKTSVQVLELLKKISEDNLVIIVSHNLDDAEKYGDRIIELSDGKIIRDVVNNGESNELIVDDNCIKLPYNAKLSDEELEIINKNKKDKEIFQHKPQFIKNREEHYVVETISLENSNLSRSARYKISKLFFKKRIVNFLLTIMMISILVVVLGLCQMFVSYKGEETIKDIFNNIEDDSLIVKKGYFSDNIYLNVNTDKLIRITDEEINSFYDKGYDGNIYRLVNATMGTYGSELELYKSVNLSNNFQNFYAKINLGLLICDEEFLIKIYGEDGKLDILAGSLDYKPYGMILTDYMADSYLYHYPHMSGTINDPYKKLIETDNINNRFAVTAIINTGYKERYNGLIEKYNEYFKAENKYEKERLKNELLSSDEYVSFYKELTNYLAITYSVNPNYLEDTIEYTNQSRIIGYYNSLDILDENGNYLKEDYILQADNYSWYTNRYNDVDAFNNNEIYLSYMRYNDIFGTNLTLDNLEEFQERTIVFKSYDVDRKLGDEPLYTKEYKVVGIHKNIGTESLLMDEEFKFIREYDVYTFGLYFDNPKDCSNFYSDFENTTFYLGTEEYNAVYQIVDVVEIFKDNFSLVATIIFIAMILLMLSFNVSNIKSNKYEIGVLRALGIKSKDIAFITMIYNFIASVAVVVLSIIGLITLTDFANDILLNSFKENINNSSVIILNNVEILTLSSNILVSDILIIIGLTVIASLFPLFLVNKIRPINIIKARE